MPASAALEVFASGRPAGLLTRSDIEMDTFLFGYRADCRAADAVSLTMPVVADQYDSMGTVHPIFEMNLPEGALLERLRLAFAKVVPSFDDLELLAIVGRSQIGRLRYAAEGSPLDPVPAQDLKQLLTYEGTEDLFKDLLARYAVHSGISGVQPKVLLRDANAPVDRFTDRGATHIVKSFEPREYPELAANEYFCMRAARHAGIAIPEVRLSQNRRILVIDRFDLIADGSYLACEDFCVLSGLRSHGRYDGSYELVARRIGQFVSPEHQRSALEQLFAMVALSCAIENGDAHLKNFAVLYEGAQSPTRLAPAYDLVSTTVYHPRDVMALTLSGSKSFPDRRRLTAFGRRGCGLPGAKVREILDRVEFGVSEARTSIRQFARQHRDFARAGEYLLAAFARGLERSIVERTGTAGG
ncbi:MAG: type II toxin-antitoxin system HipA family toxin [Steroidobacteraceae bacterium]